MRGEKPGYSVHVGVDLENTIKRYREAGLTVNCGSRWLLDPHAYSSNESLTRFKESGDVQAGISAFQGIHLDSWGF